MRFYKNILGDIINQLDILNTINGGVSMTSVKILLQDNHYIVKVHTPGIDKYAYHVEVANNMLLIYTLLSIEKNDEPIQVPSFLRYIPLPNNADAEAVRAVHEDNELKIMVPLDTSQNLKQRKIDIDYL